VRLEQLDDAGMLTARGDIERNQAVSVARSRASATRKEDAHNRKVAVLTRDVEWRGAVVGGGLDLRARVEQEASCAFCSSAAQT